MSMTASTVTIIVTIGALIFVAFGLQWFWLARKFRRVLGQPIDKEGT
jgi:hypothetical protein